ncbi:hypothetical protein [Duganella violaceipulchra]|uniref:Plasmid maintenance system antidote protein VapI n=1 Tax=Duganella violaceipulchra TaxID=2849652 RepID=A0AA41HDQ9_9BURK|nr:hypothetical protein [Duganella violaceicalia]MBV6321938.1 hypothetical protein [Duganella violaceicalia]MCP2007068.1 plasmid maintenance system antidote protein VapI [Duganella violaceicalia]
MGSESPERGTVAKLLDFVKAERGLMSDAELAREMGCDTAYVCNLRKERIALSSNTILNLHINFGIGVQEIFDRSGQQFRWGK